MSTDSARSAAVLAQIALLAERAMQQPSPDPRLSRILAEARPDAAGALAAAEHPEAEALHPNWPRTALRHLFE